MDAGSWNVLLSLVGCVGAAVGVEIYANPVFAPIYAFEQLGLSTLTFTNATVAPAGGFQLGWYRLHLSVLYTGSVASPGTTVFQLGWTGGATGSPITTQTSLNPAVGGMWNLKQVVYVSPAGPVTFGFVSGAPINFDAAVLLEYAALPPAITRLVSLTYSPYIVQGWVLLPGLTPSTATTGSYVVLPASLTPGWYKVSVQTCLEVVGTGNIAVALTFLNSKGVSQQLTSSATATSLGIRAGLNRMFYVGSGQAVTVALTTIPGGNCVFNLSVTMEFVRGAVPTTVAFNQEPNLARLTATIGGTPSVRQGLTAADAGPITILQQVVAPGWYRLPFGALATVAGSGNITFGVTWTDSVGSPNTLSVSDTAQIYLDPVVYIPGGSVTVQVTGAGSNKVFDAVAYVEQVPVPPPLPTTLPSLGNSGATPAFSESPGPTSEILTLPSTSKGSLLFLFFNNIGLIQITSVADTANNSWRQMVQSSGAGPPPSIVVDTEVWVAQNTGSGPLNITVRVSTGVNSWNFGVIEVLNPGSATPDVGTLELQVVAANKTLLSPITGVALGAFGIVFAVDRSPIVQNVGVIGAQTVLSQSANAANEQASWAVGIAPDLPSGTTNTMGAHNPGPSPWYIGAVSLAVAPVA